MGRCICYSGIIYSREISYWFAIRTERYKCNLGAAGSAVIFILRVFYSSIILFFDAEITQHYAEYYNYEIKPEEYAIRIEINELTDDKL